MTRARTRAARCALALLAAACLGGAEGRTADRRHWVRVPLAAHLETNPYAGQGDAVRAGRKLFARHCAACHAQDGGARSAPLLDAATLGRATPGDLFWFLTNGDLRAGMPSWSRLPDQRRWQIVAFLGTLGEEAARP